MVMKVARFLCGTINAYHKIYQVTRQVSERPEIFQECHYQCNSSCAQSSWSNCYDNHCMKISYSHYVGKCYYVRCNIKGNSVAN